MENKNIKILLTTALVLTAVVIFLFFTYLQISPLTRYLSLGAALFSIGVYGLLTSNSIIKSFVCLEILLNSANLNFIAFSRFMDLAFVRGQMFSLFVMAVAAAEIALGLALAILIYRHKHTNSLQKMNELKED
jgi:NADH:ubiquinone oxidoreductase subunit K